MNITRQQAIGATSGVVLAGAVVLIQPWEGLYTKPYLDIVGVRTVCYGETAADGVDFNRTYTPQQRRDLLKTSIVKYDNGVKKCIGREIPDSVHVALISIAYNVGVGAVCGGTIARRAKAGDWQGTCDALLLYDRAGGRVVKGLENRRNAERDVCMKDADP